MIIRQPGLRVAKGNNIGIHTGSSYTPAVAPASSERPAVRSGYCVLLLSSLVKVRRRRRCRSRSGRGRGGAMNHGNRRRSSRRPRRGSRHEGGRGRSSRRTTTTYC